MLHIYCIYINQRGLRHIHNCSRLQRFRFLVYSPLSCTFPLCPCRTHWWEFKSLIHQLEISHFREGPFVESTNVIILKFFLLILENVTSRGMRHRPRWTIIHEVKRHTISSAGISPYDGIFEPFKSYVLDIYRPFRLTIMSNSRTGLLSNTFSDQSAIDMGG